jgi:hypothetical protein
MPVEYLTFGVEPVELNRRLNEHADDGWKLHSIVSLPNGVLIVVMKKAKVLKETTGTTAFLHDDDDEHIDFNEQD